MNLVHIENPAIAIIEIEPGEYYWEVVHKNRVIHSIKIVDTDSYVTVSQRVHEQILDLIEQGM